MAGINVPYLMEEDDLGGADVGYNKRIRSNVEAAVTDIQSSYEALVDQLETGQACQLLRYMAEPSGYSNLIRANFYFNLEPGTLRDIFVREIMTELRNRPAELAEAASTATPVFVSKHFIAGPLGNI